MVVHLNGSPIGKKELLCKDFVSLDFPEGSDLALFEVEIFVLLAGDTEIQAGRRVAFPVAFGNNYVLIIAGSADSGFTLDISETLG